MPDTLWPFGRAVTLTLTLLSLGFASYAFYHYCHLSGL